MKDGFYLSTYFYINELAYITDIELRHDMNMSLWEKKGNVVKLLRYWELERVTGLKQHRKAFFDTEHAKIVINKLLAEFNLSINDMNEIWGTPQLDTCDDYHSLDDYNQYCYHSICHLFSSLLMDTDVFHKENVLSLEVDGAPDNVLDLEIENKNYYIGCYSVAGKIGEIFPIASPGIHWGYIRDYFHLREGSLMALGTASTSKLCHNRLKLIMPKDKNGVSEVIDDINELIKFVNGLSDTDVGSKFNGFDPAFSKEENKISMVVKEVQRVSLEIMCTNIDNSIRKYDIVPENTILSLSGGFSLNCPTNSYIMKKYKFKDFSAVPCVNDAGISLGTALYAFYKKMNGDLQFKLNNAFYGQNDHNIERFLNNYHKYIENVSDMTYEQIVADIEKQPVIWFQGEAEIGPRALGNRSLLGDPRNVETKKILNVIKQRQWWRPVAPVILEEYVGDWFCDSYKSPFMLNTFNIKDEKAKEVPAILHLDNSARVQTVSDKSNTELYNVLKSFKKKTGVPILCNTSLNDAGEPIINNLDELFNFAINKKIKVAYINGIRVEFKDIKKQENIGIRQRPILFMDYLSEAEKAKKIDELNPYHADEEMLTVYIQNPKLYERIDLKKEKDIRVLEGILNFRMNKFHVL